MTLVVTSSSILAMNPTPSPRIFDRIASRYALPKSLSLPFAAVCVALLMGACAQAVKTAEPEPEPQVEPTLSGTWEAVRYGRDDAGVVDEKETTTLTFTETHFFERNHVQDADGRTRYKYDRAGTVSRTETTVTKSFVDDDRISVEKDYFLADDGDVLLIHAWGDDQPAYHFDRFTRVADAPTTAGQPSTLQGTWQRSDAWDDDEDGWIENREVITFTGTRFITYGVRVNTDNDEILDTWAWQGGWIDNGASITRIEPDHVDVDKQYVIAGDTLAINPWGANEPREYLEVFTRVQDPISGGIVGSWLFEWVWTGEIYEDESDDELVTLTAEVTDESITLVREERNRSGMLGHTRTIEATWELDPAEWFVNLSIIQATNAEGEEEPVVDDHPAWAPGTMRRIALAPSAIPDHILVSFLWSEERWDDVQGQWIDNPDYPFGDYWMEWERQ